MMYEVGNCDDQSKSTARIQLSADISTEILAASTRRSTGVEPVSIRSKLVLAGLLWWGTVITFAGCGTGEPVMIPVSGKVITQSGTACEGALVVFHPRDPGRENDPKPVATCDGQGSFQLTTHQLNDGAQPGEYAVTVVWNQAVESSKLSLSAESAPSKDRLRNRYGNPQKPQLEATVSKDHHEFEFVVRAP